MIRSTLSSVLSVSFLRNWTEKWNQAAKNTFKEGGKKPSKDKITNHMSVWVFRVRKPSLLWINQVLELTVVWKWLLSQDTSWLSSFITTFRSKKKSKIIKVLQGQHLDYFIFQPFCCRFAGVLGIIVPLCIPVSAKLGFPNYFNISKLPFCLVSMVWVSLASRFSIGQRYLKTFP